MSRRPDGAADGTELSPQSQKVLASFACSPCVCVSSCGLTTGRESQVRVCRLSLHVRPELVRGVPRHRSIQRPQLWTQHSAGEAVIDNGQMENSCKTYIQQVQIFSKEDLILLPLDAILI